MRPQYQCSRSKHLILLLLLFVSVALIWEFLASPGAWMNKSSPSASRSSERARRTGGKLGGDDKSPAAAAAAAGIESLSSQAEAIVEGTYQQSLSLLEQAELILPSFTPLPHPSSSASICFHRLSVALNLTLPLAVPRLDSSSSASESSSSSSGTSGSAAPPSLPASQQYVIGSRKYGLGNQLFEVAAAVAFALSSPGTLPVYTAPTSNKHATVAYETSVFRHLCAAPEIPEGVNIPSIHSGKTPYLYNEGARSEVRQRLGGKGRIAVRLQGFWQNPRHLLESLTRAQWAALFGPPREVLQKLGLAHGIDLSTCMAVHVRRGDYVKQAYIQGLMGVEYYEAAFQAVAAVGVGPQTAQILVFSDDLEWARAQAVFTSRGAVFVAGLDEVETLYLMSACKRATICPNSTFCWWAAFLRGMGGPISLCLGPGSSRHQRDQKISTLRVSQSSDDRMIGRMGQAGDNRGYHNRLYRQQTASAS